jgi:hypothetical protein
LFDQQYVLDFIIGPIRFSKNDFTLS